MSDVTNNGFECGLCFKIKNEKHKRTIKIGECMMIVCDSCKSDRNADTESVQELYEHIYE